MTWHDFLQAARVRAVEETDAEGKVWDAELRREVGRDVTRTEELLSRRAAALTGQGSYPSFAPSLRLPRASPWLVAAGWVAAFLIGWWLAALGQESEINLLSLPLLGLLIWNVAVVLLSLWPGARKGETHEDDWRENLLKRIDRRGTPTPPADSPLNATTARFQELARPPALRRFAFRFRVWLHIGAALLALGSISGMYARGWSKEYRAVWESTLLDEAGATKFFRALFAPASVVTGQAVPLEELPGMRRRADEKAARPGDALPWIHLYAATLGLIVLVPRVLLALLERSRAGAVPAQVLQERGWQAYAQRLRSFVEGAGAPALVLTHGLEHDAASQDRWRHWAYLHWRDVGPLTFDTVPVGGEPEFVNAWLPSAARVMLIFNMAATPEPEVQGALVTALVQKLGGGRAAAGPVLLALDDAELRQRWAGFADLPAQLATRAAAWSEIMDGTGAVWHEMVMPARHAR